MNIRAQAALQKIAALCGKKLKLTEDKLKQVNTALTELGRIIHTIPDMNLRAKCIDSVAAIGDAAENNYYGEDTIGKDKFGGSLERINLHLSRLTGYLVGDEQPVVSLSSSSSSTIVTAVATEVKAEDTPVIDLTQKNPSVKRKSSAVEPKTAIEIEEKIIPAPSAGSDTETEDRPVKKRKNKYLSKRHKKNKYLLIEVKQGWAVIGIRISDDKLIALGRRTLDKINAMKKDKELSKLLENFKIIRSSGDQFFLIQPAGLDARNVCYSLLTTKPKNANADLQRLMEDENEDTIDIKKLESTVDGLNVFLKKGSESAGFYQLKPANEAELKECIDILIENKYINENDSKKMIFYNSDKKAQGFYPKKRSIGFFAPATQVEEAIGFSAPEGPVEEAIVLDAEEMENTGFKLNS